MSKELLPDERLTAYVHDAIDQPLTLVEAELAQQPVQDFLEASFAYNPFVTIQESEHSYWRYNGLFDQAVAGDTAEQLRAIQALHGVVEQTALCAFGKDLSSQTELDTEIDPTGGLLRMLRGGPDKMMNRLGHAIERDDEIEQTMLGAVLPLTLAAAIFTSEASRTGNEADGHAALQAAAIRIKQNKRAPIDRRASANDQITARAVNILRDLYWRGSSDGFQRRAMLHQGFTMLRENGLLDNDMTNAMMMGEYQDAVDHVLADVKLDLQEFGKGSVKLSEFHEYANRNGGLLSPTGTAEEDLRAKRPAFLLECQQLLSSRRLIDLFADGSTDLTVIAGIASRLNEKPLLQRLVPEPATEEIDWEPLPSASGTGQQHPHGKAVDRGDGPVIDMARVEQLDMYIAAWGAGYVARSRIPSLPEDRQYYLAILPQQVGRVTIEHAIGDNPEAGRHAVYAWRAERGLSHDGRPAKTWRDVFKEDKTRVRALGARQILHTFNLPDKILEYMTRPPEDLADKRYKY